MLGPSLPSSRSRRPPSPCRGSSTVALGHGEPSRARSWSRPAWQRAVTITIGDEKIRRATDDLVPLLDALAAEHGTSGQLLQMKWRHESERKTWRRRGDVNVGAGNAS